MPQMPFDRLDTTSDDDLLALFASGDPIAARVLMQRHLPRVLGFARRTLGEAAEAEDVAQDAFLRLWRIAPDWNPGQAQVSTWLWRVVANLCIDRLRRRGRNTALDDAPEVADDAPGALAGLIATDRAAALDAALLELPDRQRQAVILRHIEGLSNPEIATILEIGVEAVESLTARGKRTLTARLAPLKEALGYDTSF
jgi:RNA polymerase sigma-70 factor (ECF subfamily)